MDHEPRHQQPKLTTRCCREGKKYLTPQSETHRPRAGDRALVGVEVRHAGVGVVLTLGGPAQRRRLGPLLEGQPGASPWRDPPPSHRITRTLDHCGGQPVAHLSSFAMEGGCRGEFDWEGVVGKTGHERKT